ncbi:chemotaxis protein CheW [Clostridium estertheticum]|uniref:Chemotaxis protein CheW n=2 Tax=Clostridium estertheticum TaxID=238834 RepID=A0A1J0GH86_9CLOT|nr:chemotaxis protein CheW [Clostridium estertheticum]APC40262.1 chemotaxis protein CheW [Clostridium estertheticum subsp. estertheticum]MBW9172615.1 chemotaxis protein CheW [Clostridium estertheticum]MBX4270748.1 chemotaxis protein CheW [Clostridium estertheticum]MBZ9617935.1 chemotaxis protein CheW [Clostridium estertheticum subsp. laramiense]NNU77736.1 purine-binding chemotaxis protein CheW [Clostridium estertheticum]
MAEILEEIMETAEDTQKGKFLTFSVGKESYGIEIKFVTEIIGIQEITEVPELPDYVKGIINLRGKIIPVIDVRLRFRKEPKDYNDRTCIVVINIKETVVGLIVDNVAEVINIDDSDIVPPPQMKTGFHNRYVRGIGKVGNEVKLLLDCDKLLNDEELDKIIETV